MNAFPPRPALPARRRRVRLAVPLLVVALAAGCTDDDDPGSPGPTGVPDENAPGVTNNVPSPEGQNN